tara:strand:- start:352 stop:543 length:192 start_codon:yes stop_codon:yes gene_type:complete
MKMEKADTSLIQKYVKNLSDQNLLVLFLHYQRIIDDVNLTTLNDSVWFFVLKAEKHERKLNES